MKAKVIFVIALLCAFTGKVWANPTFKAEVSIIGRTTGSYYAYAISSTLPGGGTLSFGPNDGTGKSYVGTSHYFNTDYTIGSGITMSLHGRLNFANTATDLDTAHGILPRMTFRRRFLHLFLWMTTAKFPR